MMIRREALGADAQPCWLLIPQIEHARLSGALAAQWGAAPYAALAPRDELVAAILRHDDGWCGWERRPQVDPHTGEPRDFTEMPIDDSLLIWRESIERAAALSPLGGYVVAGHFLHLLRHSVIWEEHGARRPAAAHQWSAEFEDRRRQWLEAWRREDPAEHTAELADAGVAWLQFFDRLSLWFCMAQQHQPAELPTPGGTALKLVPRDERTVELTAWPLLCHGLEFCIAGRLVPKRRYQDAADLASVPRTAWRMQLRLTAAG